MPLRREQQSIEFPVVGRGGRRPGVGRPRAVGRKRRVPHTTRPRHARSTPVHVTLRCRADAGRLRRRVGHLAVRHALRVAFRHVERFRIVHFTIQHDHLHLIVEATSRADLARGLQGFTIAFARDLNRRLHRRGKVLADRYHATPLTSPRQTRDAIQYVLNNWRKHRADAGADGVDPFSSGLLFDGWTTPPSRPSGPPSFAVASPSTWLLTTGWRRYAAIDPRKILHHA